jgi:hypothetical protein
MGSWLAIELRTFTPIRFEADRSRAIKWGHGLLLMETPLRLALSALARIEDSAVDRFRKLFRTARESARYIDCQTLKEFALMP